MTAPNEALARAGALQPSAVLGPDEQAAPTPREIAVLERTITPEQAALALQYFSVNGPRERQELALLAGEIEAIDKANLGKVPTNEAENGRLSELLSRAAGADKRLEALRRGLQKPLEFEVKQIANCTRPLEQRLAGIITAGKDNATAWRNMEKARVDRERREVEERARKVAEEQRRQEEAAERARVEQQRAAAAQALAEQRAREAREREAAAERAKNEKLQRQAAAEALAADREAKRASLAAELARLEESTATAAAVEAENDIAVSLAVTPKAAATGTRTNSGSTYEHKRWTYEIGDEAQIPMAYWVLDTAKIQKAVNAGARKDGTNDCKIPGVVVVQVESTSVRPS